MLVIISRSRRASFHRVVGFEPVEEVLVNEGVLEFALDHAVALLAEPADDAEDGDAGL